MSRYHNLYDSSGVAKFETLGTNASTSSNSSAKTARRITVVTGGVAHFVAFGTSTVAATTGSCVVPANSTMDFHFVSGQYVAALSQSGASYITIIDSD